MSKDVLFISNGNCLACTALSSSLVLEKSFGHAEAAATLQDALKALEKHSYKLIVVFMSLPLSRLQSKYDSLLAKGTKLILIFEPTFKLGFTSLARYKAHGLVSSDITYDEFKAAIHAVMRKGQRYVSPSLLSGSHEALTKESAFSHLSHKEMDVALALMKGKRNCDIAGELFISPKTVSTYKTRIFRKLNVESEFQFFELFYRNEAISAQRNSVHPG